MTDPSPRERAIIHVDMDAFYAAVEQLDDPALRGRPVLVGPRSGRGVVLTANYAARKFGVHSAQPIAVARRRCPQAVYLRPRPGRYRDVSDAVFDVFHEFTPEVEGLSLDEAFLDVTGSLKLLGDIETIGQAIVERIRQRTGLWASIGMAHNKFLAKLASDVGKPRGIVRVRAGEEQVFLDPMPVRRLWGIGARTEPRLHRLGILTVGQLRKADPETLRPALGNRTAHFRRLAAGLDEREVVSSREDKSISHEVTFENDIREDVELLAELQWQTEAVMRRVRRRGLVGRTVQIKLRTHRFDTHTRSRSLRAPTQATRTAWIMVRALFRRWRSEHESTPLRLVGMGLSGLEIQHSHDLGQALPGDDIDRTLDDIGQRFGDGTVTHALALRRHRKD